MPALPELLRGDCLTQMATVADGSIDLAFANPPFNIGYEYDAYQNKRKSDDCLA